LKSHSRLDRSVSIMRFTIGIAFGFANALVLAATQDGIQQAAVLRTQGQVTQSIELLQQAVRQATTERERMTAIGELGVSQLQARQLDNAADSLRKAYQFFAGIDRSRYALDLGNLALISRRPDEARQYYEEAARLAVDEVEIASSAMLNLIRLGAESDRLHELASLQPTLVKVKNPLARARLYLNLGAQAQTIGKPALELSFASFDLARRLSASAGNNRMLVESLDGLAQLYEDQDRHREALTLNQEAVEAARDQPASAVSDLLVGLAWRSARIYKALNEHDLALAAYERAADLLGPLRQDIPIDYEDGGSSFNRTIEPIYLGLFEGLLRVAGNQIGEARASTLRRARDAVELIKQAEMQDYLGDRCTVDTVKGGTATVIPDGTAVLYPVIFGDRIELLIETGSDIAHYSASVAGDQVRRTATLFANDLRNGMPGYLVRAQLLYDWLLRPIEGFMAAQRITTLVVVSDGALRLIAMGALHDGTRYAIEKFAVTTVTGMSMTNTNAPSGQSMRFLVAGVSEPGPVVDKLSQSVVRELLSPSLGSSVNVASVATGRGMRSVRHRGVPPLRDDLQSQSASLRAALALPGVKQEVEALGRITRSTSLLNAPFTVEGFRQEAESGAYRVVHIASHGVFGGTADSSYVLAYDDLLKLDTLQSLLNADEFRKHPIELLSLSACETAEGDERSPLGLSGAALKARAKSVLGTLWPVEDTSARKAMELFYSGLVMTQLSKAEALRQSQIELLKTNEFSHPMFWAPFVLVGNWL
jgi:CHAT domain-containing protein